MKKLVFVFCLMILLTGCSESLEDRSAREAKEYTEKYCPTPIVNGTRTDSVKFLKTTKTYTYYCSFWNAKDNEFVIKDYEPELRKLLIKGVKDNTSIEKLKEAGFNFEYIVRSGKNPDKVMFRQVITQKDYN